MEKITLSFTSQEIEIVYKGLLEMPAKLAIPIMKMIEDEVKNLEVKKVEPKDVKNK